MSQRSQIEWLKFRQLRNKPLITCTDQCEYCCFHIFCSFLSFDSHSPSSGPYEIIVIFYFLSGNLMLVISWRKFGRRDQERRLAQSCGTSLRRGLTACVRTATGVLRKRHFAQQHGRHLLFLGRASGVRVVAQSVVFATRLSLSERKPLALVLEKFHKTEQAAFLDPCGQT